MSYSRWGGSDWYIVWYDTGEFGDVEEQYLACWLAGEKKYYPVFPASDIRKMYEADDWTDFGFGENLRELDTLRECVKQWLKDIEDDEST